MSIVEAIVSYLVLWWLALFMVLPWGNRAPDRIGKGHAASAPARPRLLKKAGATTVLATFLFVIAWAIVSFGLIEVRPAQ